ncbi:hypothetical protein [Dyadobacter beijingensis]|nr:hypothetical protein [Dyadobacter beijingensis]
MNRIFITSIIALVLMCCNGESVSPREEGDGAVLVCGKKDPINEIGWLKNEMKAFQGGPLLNAVVLYSYQNKEVLELQGSVFNSTNIHQYYCDGKKLDLLDPAKYEDFKQKRIEKSVLYGTKVWN